MGRPQEVPLNEAPDVQAAPIDEDEIELPSGIGKDAASSAPVDSLPALSVGNGGSKAHLLQKVWTPLPRTAITALLLRTRRAQQQRPVSDARRPRWAPGGDTLNLEPIIVRELGVHTMRARRHRKYDG